MTKTRREGNPPHGFTRVLPPKFRSPNLNLRLAPQVGDFGLARSLESGRSHLQRTAGCVAGSLSHLAPEALLRGEMRREGDVYAFGVLRE